jgi:hypothetical protein
MRSRILRVYGELRLLEDATSRVPGSDQRKMLAQLDRLEEQVNHLRMPVTYANMLYELRAHIDLVQGRPRKLAPDETSPH